MPSLFNWNTTSLEMFSIFNRKRMPCAILQGGIVVGIFMTASQILVNPKANLREISNALITLSLTFGALSETPCLWSGLLYLFVGENVQDRRRLSTLPTELNLGISAAVALGMITPLLRCLISDNDDGINPVWPKQPQPHKASTEEPPT